MDLVQRSALRSKPALWRGAPVSHLQQCTLIPVRMSSASTRTPTSMDVLNVLRVAPRGSDETQT
jgi:hypothetical protein